MSNSKPTFGNGKICYLEIPANDVAVSSNFYQKVFNWNIRQNNQGNVAFDDGVGEVSGMWVLGKTPSNADGMLVSIMVSSIADTSKAVIANGGKILEDMDKSNPVKIALFSDPAGNVMRLYERIGNSKSEDAA
jgi:predicted enzyme related to lactoylglutathione lyase